MRFERLSLVLAVLSLTGAAASRLQAQPATAATQAVASRPATQPAFHVPGPLSVAPPQDPRDVELGSTDASSGYKLRVRLASKGARIDQIALTDYRDQAIGGHPYVVQQLVPYGHRGDPDEALKPLSALSVQINNADQPALLLNASWSLDPGAGPGGATYRVRIRDGNGQDLLEIERSFVLGPRSHQVILRQKFTNLLAPQAPGAGAPDLTVVFRQNGPVDITTDAGGYMGDRREYIAGYFNLDYDPGRNRTYTEHAIVLRDSVLGSNPLEAGTPFWPNPRLPPKRALAWLSEVNRYFAVVLYRDVSAAGVSKPADVPALDEVFQDPTFWRFGKREGGVDTRAAGLRLSTRPLLVPAGQSRSVDLALYAGPRDPTLFGGQQPYQALGFYDGLIVYDLGGCCSFLTFQWLAKGLLAFLRAIHFVFRDWGLAIIVLVLVVRALLHPITRKSQIGMAKMQKQMAALQPELEKLKKKYAGDSQKMQAEQMRLYKEKGINPLNMLGCLPMFLQMPIWIALYAMLFYAIELRHEPAFYGVFQLLTGGYWPFLADLSSADNFIPLPAAWHFTVPLLGIPVNGLHILPVLMALVFYIQSAYTTPPPANEQAAQQQKMMKWMTLLFPVFLYAAPAGLNLYIMASTGAGIVDSYIVKRHIKREEEAGTLFQSKPSRWTALMERVQGQMEARRRQITGGEGLRKRKP